MKHRHQVARTGTIETNKGPLRLECLDVFLVPAEKVRPNNYNPNHVSDNNMELLETSILQNGFCYAIPTSYDEDFDQYIVIDGFHRYMELYERLGAKVIPIMDLHLTPSRRIEATVQFNRARGVHQVDLMGDLVQKLVGQGEPDDEIAKRLGMDIEEVYRLKQVTGIAELFKNQTYSKSWEMVEVEDVE